MDRMKSKLFFVFALTLVLSAVASAQYPNNYTEYVTFSVDPNTHHALVKETISGTTLPPVPNMPGAYHKAIVQVNVNGYHSEQSGPQVCTSCNVNYSFTFDED